MILRTLIVHFAANLPPDYAYKHKKKQKKRIKQKHVFGLSKNGVTAAHMLNARRIRAANFLINFHH